MNSDNFQYYAFISYSHADEKWAKWLHKKLETYKLPNIVRKEGGISIPKYIRPIFRDQTDLGIGGLQQSLRQELTDSKYLIVICSPNSAKSSWVNKETQAFIDMGRTNRIIPFIVEGTPAEKDEEKQCYPPALLNLEDEILGASLEELKPEEALIKIIAAILGLKYDQLYRRHIRRERKNKLIYAVVIGLLALSLSMGGYSYWDYNRVKVRYFADYSGELGVPAGVFELSKNNIAARFENYRFEYSKGKLRKVVHADSAGTPIPSDDSEFMDRPMIQEFFYKADGTLDHIDYLDRNDRVLVRYNYSGKNLSVVDFSQADKYDSAVTLSGKTTSRYAGYLNALTDTSQKSDIARYLVERDESQRPTKIRFMRDNRNTPVKDTDGVYGMEIKYNSMGREKQIIYIDDQGNPWPTHLGIMGKRFYYDGAGNLNRVEFFDKDGKIAYNPEFGFSYEEARYDKNGNPISNRMYDEHGNLCMQKDLGVAGSDIKYDEHGFKIGFDYIGIDGKYCYSNEGLVHLSEQYDSDGNIIKLICKDINNSLCNNKYGYAVCNMVYDKHGNVISYNYFGTDGKPTVCNAGYHNEKITYNKLGFITLLQYFDINGKPCLDVDSEVFSIQYYYNEQNKAVRVISLGIDGKPCINNNLYSEALNKFDERGNLIEQKYVDTDGRPCLDKDYGVAGIQYEYDAIGNQIYSVYLGIDDKPMIGNEGFAEERYEYDNHGNLISSSFYGTDGKLCLNKDGAAEIKYIYDYKGNEIEEDYFGKNGERVLSSEICALKKFKYDENGNVVEQTYFGVDEKPIVIDKGYAKYQSKFDEKGNLIEQSYYDANENPAYLEDGYAKIKWIYNDMNLEVEACYLDGKGKPILNKYGFAKTVTNWDEQTRKVKEAYSGLDDKPCINNYGYASKIWKYNKRGNLVRYEYLDTDNNLCFSSDDCSAGVSYAYNDRDLMTEKVFLGLDGKAYMSYYGYALERDVYDERGNIIEIKYFDSDNVLCSNWYGYAIVKIKYDERGNNIDTTYYDAAEKPCISYEGIAGYISKYDNRNRIVSRFTTDVDGKYKMYSPLNSNESGYAGYELKYDEHGNYIEKRFYNTQGNISCTDQGYAIVQYTYGPRGNLTYERFLRDDGSLITNTKLNYAWSAKTYDDRGKVILEQFFQPDGKPCEKIHAGIIYKYDDRGKEVEKIFIDKDGTQIPSGSLLIAGEILHGSPAEKAGVKPNDVIVQLNDWSFFSGLSFDKICNEFSRALSAAREKGYRLKIIRDNSIYQFNFPPGSIGIRFMDYPTSEKEVDLIHEIVNKESSVK